MTNFELNIEDMPSVFKSHVPAWLFLIIVVTGKITGITITIKIRGRVCVCVFCLRPGFWKNFF